MPRRPVSVEVETHLERPHGGGGHRFVLHPIDPMHLYDLGIRGLEVAVIVTDERAAAIREAKTLRLTLTAREE